MSFEQIRGENGVVYLRSRALSAVPHGFSTRIGGVSRHDETATLNLGRGFADDDETVTRNLMLFAEAVGVPAQTLVSLRQTHSATVRMVSEADAGLGYFRPSERTADGYVTQTRGITLGVRTADCLPILLLGLDEMDRPCAVGALHAGWRGTLGGIAARGVQAMGELGIPPTRLRVAMGPCIGACCFEVGEQVYDAFLEELGKKKCNEVSKWNKNAGRWHIDLQKINRELLMESGLPAQNVDSCAACTKCQKEHFFSHRRDGMARGSMLSVICLP